jgi:hypothetical protein
MSAMGSIIDRDLSKLAPKFHAQVAMALEMCHKANLDAVVWEANRSNELQALYYARGRPPSLEYPTPVTNAPTSNYSWHGYGLAVDVISQKERWFGPNDALLGTMYGDARKMYLAQRKQAGDRWFWQVAQIFKRAGCDWGGDWTHADPPHFQFGGLKASPSDRARELLRAGGPTEVWRVVSAM